ncbi:hypothetical protein AGR5A_Cc190044 [Agrobacterium genomosp. 5 str. CFBP 6626]|nr:hypothetical protein AGR5A_Cc190044 [Agrobacterium genomosp. 5 str. CFBP 6626]
MIDIGVFGITRIAARSRCLLHGATEILFQRPLELIGFFRSLSGGARLRGGTPVFRMFVTVKATSDCRGEQRRKLGIDIEVFLVASSNRLGFENADGQFRHVHLDDGFRMFFRLADLRRIERQAFQSLRHNRLRRRRGRTRLNGRSCRNRRSDRRNARLRRGLFPHRLRCGGSDHGSNRLLANGLRRGCRCDLGFGNFRKVEIKIEIVKRKLEIIVVEACKIAEIRLLSRDSGGNGRCPHGRRSNLRLHPCSLNGGCGLNDRRRLDNGFFATARNGIFRHVVDQLVHRRQIGRNRLLNDRRRYSLRCGHEGFSDRRHKCRRCLFRLNDGRCRYWLDLRLDSGCGLLFRPWLDPPRINSRNIATRAEIGKRQAQAGKLQRRTAALRRRTHGNGCGRFLGNRDLHLIGKIKGLRLRRVTMRRRNVAGNVGRKFRHGVPFGLGWLNGLRLFPCQLLGGLLVNHRLGSTRLARMHIKNFCNRAGIVTEIRSNVLRRGFDVIVDIGLIDLRKRLFRDLGCNLVGWHRLRRIPGLDLRLGRGRKLRLAAGEDLLDTLHEVVGVDAGTNIVCRIKNDRIGMRRVVNLEFPQKLIFEIEFGLAAGSRWRSLGTRMRRTIFEADDTRQFCQRIVVSEAFGPGVPVIRDIFFDHYVFHHLRIAALASVL